MSAYHHGVQLRIADGHNTQRKEQTTMNSEQKILYHSTFHGCNPGFNKLLTDVQDLGPLVFVSPDKSCVMTINGSYLNIFLWDNMRREYVAQECRSDGSIESMYDMTLRQIDQFAKESYVWFMKSWFDIDIDIHTLP